MTDKSTTPRTDALAEEFDRYAKSSQSYSDNHTDPVEKAWGQGRASAYRRCAESARSRPEDRDARIVELEKLVDRAYKMMQMAGYRITSQDTEHNNPLVSWMSDVRALKPSPSALNPKAAWPFPDAAMSQQERK
jgi:hypothetical protein